MATLEEIIATLPRPLRDYTHLTVIPHRWSDDQLMYLTLVGRWGGGAEDTDDIMRRMTVAEYEVISQRWLIERKLCGYR